MSFLFAFRVFLDEFSFYSCLLSFPPKLDLGLLKAFRPQLGTEPGSWDKGWETFCFLTASFGKITEDSVNERRQNANLEIVNERKKRTENKKEKTDMF